MANPIIAQATVQTPIGPLELNLSIPINSTDNIDINQYNLTASETTVPVPTWAVLCIIEPNVANTNDLVMRLNTGDTARNIAAISPTLLGLDNDELPTSVYLTSSGTDANPTTVTFL